MVALLQYNWYPYKKGTFGHRCTHRGKATGRLTLCCHKPGHHKREREAWKRSSSGPYVGAYSSDTWFWTPSLQNCETINKFLLVKPLSLWYFVVAVLGNEDPHHLSSQTIPCRNLFTLPKKPVPRTHVWMNASSTHIFILEGRYSSRNILRCYTMEL